jgi:hypothetical protein
MNFTKAAMAVDSAIGVSDLLKSVEGLELNDILGVIGLERKPSSLARFLPAAGLIAFSAAIGAGVALLLAPSSGTKLRARLSDGLDDAKNRLNDTVAQNHATTKDPRHAVS